MVGGRGIGWYKQRWQRMTKAWREEEGRHIGNTDIVQVVVDLLQGSLVLGSDGRPGPGEGVRRRGRGEGV